MAGSDSDDSWNDQVEVTNPVPLQTNDDDDWGLGGNSNDSGSNRGRGRGGRGGGGRGGGSSCYKCNETGHFARECPNSENNDSGYNRNGGGGGGSNCYKCNETGHFARECPNSEDNGDSNERGRGRGRGRGGGGRGGGRGCFKCGDEGHMSRNCTSDGGDGGGSKRGCFKCGEEGHMSRDCNNNEAQGGEKKSGCFKCGEGGHFARECPNPEKEGDGDKPRAPLYTPVETDEQDLFTFGIDAGANFSILQEQKVVVDGNGHIPPITNFEDCNLRKLLLDNVKQANYKCATPIQKHALPIILAGRDVMACAQTGSGKTAAFVLPVLHYILEKNCECGAFEGCAKPTALIVTPTRELAIQIYDEARKFAYGSSVRCVVSYGGTSVQHQRSQLARGCHFLVATPGRLKDFVERGTISFESLKFLILDEADRMLDMGFSNDIKTIVNHSSMPDKQSRNTLMFSATFPENIQSLAAEYLNDYLFIRVGLVGAANADVRQDIQKVDQTEKRSALQTTLTDILAISADNKTVVFVETKRNADFLAAYLSGDADMSCTSIHGDRFQKQREEALSQFKMGIRNILIATSVAARGLDIKGVNYVINYDLPKTIDDYVHRIGRTGRVGNTGNAISFFCEETDDAIAKDLVKVLSEANQEVPDWLLEYAKSSSGVQTYQGANKFGTGDIRKRGGGGNNGDAFAAVGGPSEAEQWDSD